MQRTGDGDIEKEREFAHKEAQAVPKG